jgi:hypothetical protein
MWWIAALLSAIVWVVAWSSGFLGPVAHVFLLLVLLALLAQALAMLSASASAEEAGPPNESLGPPPVATGGAERATAEAGDEGGSDGTN